MDSDGDGLSAGGLLCGALARVGIPFQAASVRGRNVELRSTAERLGGDLLVVCDLGSDLADVFGGRKSPIVVLDHHPPGKVPPDTTLVNPHLAGIDGTFAACSATVAYSVARAMDENAIFRFGTCLAGIIADRQHRGGLQGLNHRYLQEAERRGIVRVRRGIALPPGPVGSALADAVEPFWRGLTGHPDPAGRLVRDLGLDPATPVGSLREDETSALASVLVLRLLGSGVLPEAAREAVCERFWLEQDGMDAADLSSRIDACGRSGALSRGLAAAMGDPAARNEAAGIAQAWRVRVRQALEAVEDRGAEVRGSVHVLRVAEPPLAGEVAGIATNYLLAPERPVIALAPAAMGIKVSARATRRLVGRGLDLGRALGDAARAVKGRGGGHPIASGATIPAGTEDLFLELVEAAVARSLAAAPQPSSAPPAAAGP